MTFNFNPDNFVNVTGRIESDIAKGTFANQDGSRKMRITLAVQNSYKGKDGKYGKQDIPVDIFIPAKQVKIDENGNEDLGIYGNLRTGDLINVIGHLQTNNYVGKDGKMVYGGIVLQCDTIRFREPKSVSDARAANKATAVAPQEAPPTV